MKKEVLKEEVDQLISQSFWGKSGVSLKEDTQVQEDVGSEVQSDDDDSQEEVVTEETHTCPLCESTLENDISDEKLTEHIEMMLGIINEMNDITDEELESIEEDIDSDDQDEEEVGEDLDEESCGTGAKMKDSKGQAKKMKALMAGKKK